jgi:hypothetical protein
VATFTARAQQPGIPVIGLLNAGLASQTAFQASAFRKGLLEFGYVDGKHAVTNGRVILEEQRQDVLWRVEGKDIDDNNRIQVVVAVYEKTVEIKMITAF